MAQPIQDGESRFSVVVPVYNKRPHIERAIDSVLAQTLPAFEIILVDDASHDGSLEAMRSYSDPRLRILVSEAMAPSGPGAARNRGVAAARASWIAFLDADDEWHREHLAELDALIQTVPEAGIVGTRWRIAESADGQTTPARSGEANAQPGPIERFDLKAFLRSALAGDRAFRSSGVAVERRLLARIGGFPEGGIRRGEDVDTWLRAMAECGLGARSQRVTSLYHRDSVNMITQFEPFYADPEARTVRDLVARAPDGETARLLKRFLNTRLIARYLSGAFIQAADADELWPNLYARHLTWKQRAIVGACFLPKGLWRALYRLYKSAATR